jgi:hypothetical protein
MHVRVVEYRSKLIGQHRHTSEMQGHIPLQKVGKATERTQLVIAPIVYKGYELKQAIYYEALTRMSRFSLKIRTCFLKYNDATVQQ